MTGRFGVSRGLLAACLVAALLVAVPVFVTIVQALQGGISAARSTLGTHSTVTLVLHSLEIAGAASPICAVIGVAAAWFVERTTLPGRRFWAVVLVAPLTIPPFVTSYAWAYFGPAFQGFVGAAGIVAFTYYPIVFLLVMVALRGLDPALEETSRSLGMGGWRTFFRVVLPQVKPALYGGVLLVVLDALIEFDAFVGLKFQTFSFDVYAQYQLGFSPSGAAALSFASIGLCLVLLFGEARLRGYANYTRVSQGARRVAQRYELGRATIPVLLVLGAVSAISVGIPVGMLVKWFSQSTNAALSTASGNLKYLFPATVTSVEMGAAAAVVGFVLALPVAVAAVRSHGKVVTVLERVTYLSFALPDLVAAIALAYAASHWVHFLYGSFTLLVFAEAILFVPFAVVALRAALGQLEPALEESARSLGSGALASFWRVTMPLARPGIAAALVLVFAFTLGDLSTAQILLPVNLYTLGTEFNANSSTVAFAAASPFAAVLIVLALVAAYSLMTRFGRVRTLTRG
ncbi:MAG TPA: iron ABC transporter permease [Gaiellaceae bacterium]|nr:iron ABC transporter permease [Gaiellaceae bacterium]